MVDAYMRDIICNECYKMDLIKGTDAMEIAVYTL